MKENRRIVAIANLCIGFLYLKKFISEEEHQRIFNKIQNFEKKNNVRITSEQLSSARFSYDDNAIENK